MSMKEWMMCQVKWHNSHVFFGGLLLCTLWWAKYNNTLSKIPCCIIITGNNIVRFELNAYATFMQMCGGDVLWWWWWWYLYDNCNPNPMRHPLYTIRDKVDWILFNSDPNSIYLRTNWSKLDTVHCDNVDNLDCDVEAAYILHTVVQWR